MYTFNFSTHEAEAGRYVWVTGQAGLHSKLHASLSYTVVRDPVSKTIFIYTKKVTCTFNKTQSSRVLYLQAYVWDPTMNSRFKSRVTDMHSQAILSVQFPSSK